MTDDTAIRDDGSEDVTNAVSGKMLVKFSDAEESEDAAVEDIVLAIEFADDNTALVILKLNASD